MIGLILPSFEQYRYVRELRKKKRRQDEQQRQQQQQPTKPAPFTTASSSLLFRPSGEITVVGIRSSFSSHKATNSKPSADIVDNYLTCDKGGNHVTQNENTLTCRHSSSGSCIRDNNDTKPVENDDDDDDDETVIPEQEPPTKNTQSSSQLSSQETRLPNNTPLPKSKGGSNNLTRRAPSETATPLTTSPPPHKVEKNVSLRQDTATKWGTTSDGSKSERTRRIPAVLSIATCPIITDQAESNPCRQEPSPLATNLGSDWISTKKFTSARRRRLEMPTRTNNGIMSPPLPTTTTMRTPEKKNRQSDLTARSGVSSSFTASTGITTATPESHGTLTPSPTPTTRKENMSTATAGPAPSVWDSPEANVQPKRPTSKRPWFQRNGNQGRHRRRKLHKKTIDFSSKKAS